MADKKLRTLLGIRRVLIVLAVALFCLSTVSGVLHFTDSKGARPQPPAETTTPTTMPTTAAEESTETEPVETTQAETHGDGSPFEEEDTGKQQAEESSGSSSETTSQTPEPTVEHPSEDPVKDSEETVKNNESITESEKVEDRTESEKKENEIESDKTENKTDSGTVVTPPAPAGPPTSSTSNSDTVTNSPPAAQSDTHTVVQEGMYLLHGEIENSSTEDVQQETEIDTTATEPLPAVEESVQDLDPWGLVFWLSLGLFAADLIAILAVSVCIGKQSEKTGETPTPTQKFTRTVQIGKVHQVGARAYQQDSLGHTAVLNGAGTFAVVADGMGGLSNSDRVSQQVVMEMLMLSQKIKAGQTQDALRKILTQVNHDINEMLGKDGLYKSGSTVVAVLVAGKRFQWIAVGDSRIYLYREGYVNQLNQDHDQLQLWMKDILAGNMSYEEAVRNPDARKLTSFIGMGDLRFVDSSLSPIELLPGDRIVLMSDGVYSALNEDQLAKLLKKYPDVKDAASAMDSRIQDTHNPHQDNYSALILGF